MKLLQPINFQAVNVLPCFYDLELFLSTNICSDLDLFYPVIYIVLFTLLRYINFGSYLTSRVYLQLCINIDFYMITNVTSYHK